MFFTNVCIRGRQLCVSECMCAIFSRKHVSKRLSYFLSRQTFGLVREKSISKEKDRDFGSFRKTKTFLGLDGFILYQKVVFSNHTSCVFFVHKVS